MCGNPCGILCGIKPAPVLHGGNIRPTLSRARRDKTVFRIYTRPRAHVPTCRTCRTWRTGAGLMPHAYPHTCRTDARRARARLSPLFFFKGKGEMVEKEIATFAEFAARLGCKRSYVTELRKAGRLVLTDDGKVKVAESIARIEATR